MEVTIVIRIDKDKKDDLEAQAQKRGLNLSAYCRMVLLASLPQESAE